ncbi:MAG: SIS domain-containing protein [Ignavibacteriae bacterium]|nr:SIS domain-containing protein [Ignavibacteriota bacterium]
MINFKDYIYSYLAESAEIISRLDKKEIEKTIRILHDIKLSSGRLFILGVGGSAANASHAVNDFRKIGGIESYTPTDNVSELTARTNDDGWDTVFINWLKGSRLNEKDCILVFSVGGGNVEKNVSVNLVKALQFGKEVKAKIIGIVGRDGGFTKQIADSCILIPVVNNDTITPHSEAFQAVVWHLLVTHPAIKSNEMKWESTK